jgi:2-pyrone-4,6-dicarboxylate lactonase
MTSPSFEADPGWLTFQPDPSRPAAPLPPGTVDSHCHVFGPGRRFPYSAGRKYTPADAGREDLFRLRDFLGVEKNVIVQATCHGTDNSALVDALQAADGRARGVAAVDGDVSDDELRRLHEAGVRGVRFNFVRRLADPAPDGHYRAIAERIAPFGWHAEAYFEAADLPAYRDLLTSLPVPVVIDHMGRPNVTKGVDGADFRAFLALLRENPRFWVKVTGPERLTVSGPPGYDDVVPFAAALVEQCPRRVLWGTDWPHPNLRSHMPDDGNLVDFAHRVAVTPRARRLLFTENPGRLYWDNPAVACADDLDDIPGTVVFTGQRACEGYQLNQFCMSLNQAGNRARFKDDERGYLDEWPLTAAQKAAVLSRDWNAAVAVGGNIYFLSKILAADGTSFPRAASVMTGVSVEEYAAMMLAGGRSPEGQRSIREGR